MRGNMSDDVDAFISVYYDNNQPKSGFTWKYLLDDNEKKCFTKIFYLDDKEKVLRVQTINISSEFEKLPYINFSEIDFKTVRFIPRTDEYSVAEFTFIPKHFKILKILDSYEQSISADLLLEPSDKVNLKSIIGDEIKIFPDGITSVVRAREIQSLSPIKPEDLKSNILTANRSTFYNLKLLYKDRITNKFIGFDFKPKN